MLQRALEVDSGVVVAVPVELSRSLSQLKEDLERTRGRSVAPLNLAGRERRYLSVSSLARILLRRLPDRAVAAYRARFEAAGSELLERYSKRADERSLERLARSYFLTTSGHLAIEIEGDRWLETGGGRMAYVRYLEALTGCAVSERSEGRLALKLLLALRLAGDRALYGHHLGEIRQRFAGRGDAAARLWAAVERLEQDVPLERPEEREPEARTSVWGGELPVERLPELPGAHLARSWESWVWSEPHKVVESRAVSGIGEFRFRHRGPRGRFEFDQRGIEYPFVPLVDDERIWISSVFNVYRLDGRPGAGSALEQRPKPDPARLLRSRFKETSESTIYALSLWKQEWEEDFRGGRSFPAEILIGQFVSGGVQSSRFMGYSVTSNIPVRSLVAFDARGGRKPLWATSPRDPKRPATLERLEAARRERLEERLGRPRLPGEEGQELYGPSEIVADICYTSPAVVKGGVVYAAGWNQEGFINSVVRALDLRTGKTIWETLVSSTQMEMTMFGEIAREPFASFVVERDGVLYCQTNLGTVAALDARNGRLRWVNAYDVIPVEAANGPFAHLRSLPWSVNPPLLVGHVLIVTPRDSQYVYAIDTGEGPDGEEAGGRVLWSYRNSTGDIRDLLGWYRRRLYFTGSGGAAYLDLEPMGPRGNLERRRSPRLVTEQGARGRQAVPARGALTRSGVVFADQERLWLTDLDLRKRHALLPGTFPESSHGRYPGRVQIVGDLVLITSHRLVSAFAPVTQ